MIETIVIGTVGFYVVYKLAQLSTLLHIERYNGKVLTVILGLSHTALEIETSKAAIERNAPEEEKENLRKQIEIEEKQYTLFVQATTDAIIKERRKMYESLMVRIFSPDNRKQSEIEEGLKNASESLSKKDKE